MDCAEIVKFQNHGMGSVLCLIVSFGLNGVGLTGSVNGDHCTTAATVV